MKKIQGNVRSLKGCSVTTSLTIEIETTDEIRLTEILGKDVEIFLK